MCKINGEKGKKQPVLFFPGLLLGRRVVCFSHTYSMVFPEVLWFYTSRYHLNFERVGRLKNVFIFQLLKYNSICQVLLRSLKSTIMIKVIDQNKYILYLDIGYLELFYGKILFCKNWSPLSLITSSERRAQQRKCTWFWATYYI